MVLFRFQSVDDLLSGLIGRRAAFRMKFSHDVVKTVDTDLSIIGKFQRAPPTWRRRRDSSIFSPPLFILEMTSGILGHIL